MNEITLYFPRWFYENNLGDSCVFAIVPKLIKDLYPDTHLTVVSYGSILPLLKNDKNIDSVRGPTTNEILNPNIYIDYAMNRNSIDSGLLVIYPENHPSLLSTIASNFDKFVNHPSINFIVLNYLLQLKIKDPFSLGDFYKFESKNSTVYKKNDKLKIAICPMTKKNGKPTPHPGCDGEGFRFNGVNGVSSWKTLVAYIKSKINVDFYEFSPNYLGLGDYHKGIKESMYELYKDSYEMDYAITTDGGYHHLFNLSRKPITLFTGTKVTKPEFMQLGNAYVPDIHLDCRKTCESFYSEVFNVEDKSKVCNLECEQLDPIKLATLCIEDIYKRVYEK